MSIFNTYQKSPLLQGDEVLVIADSSGRRTLTATASQIAGAPACSEATGYFYQNKGAKISRFSDRVLIGGAAKSSADSERDLLEKEDWLSQEMNKTSVGPWAMQGAQSASLAAFGNSAFVAASRTTDAKNAVEQLGYQPSSIGVASWGVADDTSTLTTTTAYAYYGEAWRLAGVNYQPTFGMELEAVNFGGLAIGVSTPYQPNVGGGVYGVQLGVGGGQTAGTSDAAAGIVFVSNPNSWQTGIVFGSTSLSGTNGNDTGYGAAVSLARNHAIEWHTPEEVSGQKGGNVGAFIRSTVTQRDKGVRQEFVDQNVLFSNIDGKTIFSIVSQEDPTNNIQVQSASGPQAAGIYILNENTGSPNLGLFPGKGGELQITSPVSNNGRKLPSIPDGGFLHININGQDYRIPLMSPEQAGE
ncbi:hypothetical protein [Swingsia samuiensis]|uniref:Uncharacterized protein n=1 Tax=Swingsia samuiensis TaxID=1293412 RepID=A0A4Y6UK79_9PROT|nr:hypothetical protein [Swingsia samuiensis]QDH16777.1 hypothetical protein E3D00_03740 [Swingsia samuiensis]